MSAIAAVTTRLRLIAAAIIAPLRHPILLAHQLATLDLLCEGRLVVQPTVSWHREEYEALGVPFERRGELLDEHLAAWRALWGSTPASFAGRHYQFADVYLEPKPWRPEGLRLWFGGMTVGPWIVRRLVEYGHGFHPFGQPTVERAPAAGRGDGRGRADMAELEVVGGIRGRFASACGVADLAEAAEAIPAQLDGRLHDDLLQAVAVHRRPGRGRAAVPPARGVIRRLRTATSARTRSSHRSRSRTSGGPPSRPMPESPAPPNGVSRSRT